MAQRFGRIPVYQFDGRCPDQVKAFERECSAEYRFGAEAFRMRQPIDSCLFPASSDIAIIRAARTAWMTGWLDAWSAWKHREINKRWGV